MAQPIVSEILYSEDTELESRRIFSGTCDQLHRLAQWWVKEAGEPGVNPVGPHLVLGHHHHAVVTLHCNTGHPSVLDGLEGVLCDRGMGMLQ